MSNEPGSPPSSPPSPTVSPGSAPAKPAAAAAPAAPAPPDPRVLTLRDELAPLLGPDATWELKGTLPAFRVPAAAVPAAGRKLKEAGFDYCLFVTATDYIKENRFEMVYALTNYADGREVALVADLPRTDPVIDTVSDLWPTAEWHEREVFDLFGVQFRNHADLRRILLDDTWEGHPLRKDYVDTLHEMVKRPY